MLTGCDGCIESDSKSLSRWRRQGYVSLYRAGEDKAIERCKTRVKDAEENKLFCRSKKNIIECFGLNEQGQKFGLGSFDLKFYRLTKIDGKAENYAISTQQQLELELPFLLGSDLEVAASRHVVILCGHTSSVKNRLGSGGL